MDDNSQSQSSNQQKSPVALLAKQTQSLSDLVELQKLQKVQIADLKRQNEQIIERLSGLLSLGNNPTEVNIENINMPFLDLVGFMVKVAVASIPAAIIIGLLYALVLAIFGGILSGCT